MGIPSYFMQIVRKYPQVIKAFASMQPSFAVDHLYLDCNSVIYAAYHELAKERELPPSASSDIIRLVCSKLDEYIHLIQPQKSVLIAFDGVAPAAKLEQQRGRRFKTAYQQRMFERIRDTGVGDEATRTTAAAADTWTTTAITPGTKFMHDLGEEVYSHYAKSRLVTVSASDEYGEGEHKIFEHIRSNPLKHADACTVIYGLDADLIMLSINHLRLCPRLFLFRETPEFIQSIDASLEPGGNYLVDIALFAEKIQEERSIPPQDYIFLCFLLGNDFMPHFPSVNIRTGGHEKLMKAYAMLELGTIPERCLIRTEDYAETGPLRERGEPEIVKSDGGGVIQWRNVHALISYLATLEDRFLIQEHKQRDATARRLNDHFHPENVGKREITHTGSDREKFEQMRFEQSPQMERADERKINPFRPHWDERYYQTLFPESKRFHLPHLREQICKDYLEGLAWTYDYYTRGCPDYRWKYSYSYPPLFRDILKYMDKIDCFVQFTPSPQAEFPVSPLVQLCYVLPQPHLHLLPRGLAHKLKTYYPEWYCHTAPFIGAYCHYMWETHPQLPKIPLAQLENVVKGRKEPNSRL